MLRLFLCFAILLTSLQADSSSFYVRVEALSKYNAHHIFAYAGEFFPPDKPIKEAEVPRKIDCLVSELKASEIYEDVQAEIQPSSTEGTRLLLVRVAYCRNIKNLVVSEISPEGFPEADMEKFKVSLREKGVEPGMRFLKYNFGELTEKITESLRESHPKELVRVEDERPIWFIIRPAGYGEVKLIISSAVPKCEPPT